MRGYGIYTVEIDRRREREEDKETRGKLKRTRREIRGTREKNGG